MKTLSTKQKLTTKSKSRGARKHARGYRRTSRAASATAASQWRWQSWLTWVRLWSAAREAAKTAAVRIWHY